MEKIAVFPGSFDPFTIGHAEICRRAADLFGRVVVLVSQNSEKKTLFSAEERLEIARAACRADARLSVALCEGTVADAACALGAACVVRGLRDSADFAAEARFCGAMRELGAPEVVLLQVHREYADVSSTFVRELFYYGRDYRPYLPEAAHESVRRLLQQKQK